jgi:enoyl-CoA hydratase/carnithine racemase
MSLIKETFTDSVLELRLALNQSNTLTLDGFESLDSALARAAIASDARVLILSSDVPDTFSNGLDPLAVHGQNSGALGQLIELFFSVLKRIFLFPVPVISAINGHAIGYGAMLGLMSDFRLLVESGARVSFPELNLGISLPIFVTVALQELVGQAKTRDLLFAGFAPKPPEALAIGFADELIEKPKLSGRAWQLAKRLAALPRNAARSQKEIIRWKLGQDLEKILAQDKKNTLGLLESPEAREGFAALVEKRRPKFG